MNLKFFPDFFIIGAPRCGTTSLSRYLSTHPSICFSRPKEPHYFSTLSQPLTPSNLQRHYLERFFPHCHEGYEAVGEGSVSYLYAPRAIDRILALNPNAKFIAMLRNPVEMIHSFHSRMVYTMDEDVREFSRAWALQTRRARGEAIPRHCREPKLLQYARVGKLGEQVERFLSKVREENRIIILFDDVLADTGSVYRNVLAFIDVTDDGRRKFPPKMVSKTYRFSWLQRWLYRPPKRMTGVLEASKGKVKNAGGKKTVDVAGLRKRLVRFNTIKQKPAPLDTTIREVLRETFADDTARLGRLIGRDLSHWR